MDELTDHAQNVQRLRYEAFAKLAARINKCDNYAEIAAALTGQLKFILDTYIFKIYYRYELMAVSFRVFRGTCTYREGTAVCMSALERFALQNGLPLSVLADAPDKPDDEIFENPQVLQAAVLPAAGARYDIILTNATRKEAVTAESDFRFLREIGELVGNKLAQLILLKQIEAKNRLLEQKNDVITTLNLTLEDKVLERTEALNQANQELQNLFYSATHGLRTPITNILGLSNLANLYTTDPSLLFLFDGCKNAAESLDKLLRKLNSLSSAWLEYGLENVSCGEIMSYVKQRLEKEIAARKPIITLSGDYDSVFRSHKNMLVSIFENLVENSIVFCREQPVIDIVFQCSGNKLHVHFTDNGIGITPETAGHIFDMFYRGNELSTGSGLGLYVIKKLLKSLQGYISFAAAATGGTTFTVMVPNVSFRPQQGSDIAAPPNAALKVVSLI